MSEEIKKDIKKDIYDFLAEAEERRMASEDAEWNEYLEEAQFEDWVKEIEEGHD